MINSISPHSILPLPSNIHIIGCGGGGSWLLLALSKLAPSTSTIHLWDKDKLEPKNLDRQLFSHEDIDRPKAEALASKFPGLRITPHLEYFYEGSEVDRGSLLLCCADNHAARRNCLRKVDEIDGWAIIGGNEYVSDDAYYYEPSFRGTPNDPRVFAPEIVTDESGDPRRPQGCTGDAQVERPQLVIANIGSVYFMLKLLWWWFKEAREVDRSTSPHWPVMFSGTPNRLFYVKKGDRV